MTTPQRYCKGGCGEKVEHAGQLCATCKAEDDQDWREHEEEREEDYD